MRPFVVQPVVNLRGEIILPGDKSIAHRAIILSALSKGKTRIENFPTNKDCLRTIEAFKKLGIKINLNLTRKQRKSHRCTVTVYGKGLLGLGKPESPIFMGESGTTLRLLLGVLAGQRFKTELVAAKSLSKRPMLRVTAPLRMMGACIKASHKSIRAQEHKLNIPHPISRIPREEYPPIIIEGGVLRPITYKMPVASAQVKSAIALAALYVKDKTRIIEPLKTRDHTERMLKLFKAEIKVKANTIVIKGGRGLVSPKKIFLPGDISSAAFFIVLGVIIPGSQIEIKKVSLNPARMGLVKILKRMGADIQITISDKRYAISEPMGNIVVKGSSLRGVTIKKEEIPSLIDELPILMVAASLAKGKTVFESVSELRVKETDRIKSMEYNLRKMGVEVAVFGIGSSEKIIIRGVKRLKGAYLKSFADHRTAMSMVVAALNADGKSSIDDISCVDKSFPDFLTLLNTLKA